MRNDVRYANILHRVFAFGIWVKGIDGVLEIVGGFLLLLISSVTLNRWVSVLTQHELVEDPHDVIATMLRSAAAQLSVNTHLFASIYLIAHGLVKVGLVAGLLRGKRWAYPTAIGFLVLFILYQLYQMSYAYSLGLLMLTLFDVVIVALTWYEYQAHRV